MNQDANRIKLDTLIESSPALKQGIEQANSQLFFIPFMTPDKFADAI